MSKDPPLHHVGTREFLPSLISYIRNSANTSSLPLDHVIFQSILLCVIAGDKHLILRTPEEDVNLVVKLAVWTLSSVFSFPTHKLKIRPTGFTSKPITSSLALANPATFLRSLFLPSSPLTSSSNSNQTSQDEGSAGDLKYIGHHRQHAHFRFGKHRAKYGEYSRSRSFPNSLAAVAQTHGAPLSSKSSLMQPIEDPKLENSNPSTVKPGAPLSSESSLMQPIEDPKLENSYGDPSTSNAEKKATFGAKPLLQLPVALVLSGLEDAPDSSQRALSTVLFDKRVVLEGNHDLPGSDDQDGVWNLPDGFIAVYVCPWNARERPLIHKSLLDKFAMSTNVFISQSIRHDFHSLSFSHSRPFNPNFVSYSTPNSPSPAHPMSLPPTHSPPTFTKPLPSNRRPSTHFNPPPLPDNLIPATFIKALQNVRKNAFISPRLSLYLMDIISATRHHSRLDGMLLTAKSVTDAEDLIRASRVIGSDLTGMELLRPPPNLHNSQDDESSESEIQVIPSKSPKVKVASDPFPIPSTATMSESGSGRYRREEYLAQVLDVSEVDVARITPRVVSHRIRLRDGPQDEVLSSVLYGATFSPPATGPSMPLLHEGEEILPKLSNLSVKEILVQILAAV